MTTADLERLGYVKKVQPLSIVKVKWQVVILIICLLGVAGICLFSSCDKITVPARASEILVLKASYYSIASLKRDGQSKITKGVCADGSIFNDNNLTGASRDFNLGDTVRVTNLQNGKQVVIKITDRINKRFEGIRIDLSKSAFQAICKLDKGLCMVKVERL